VFKTGSRDPSHGPFSDGHNYFKCSYTTTLQAAAWRSGNVVGHINEVTLRRARLLLAWVTVFGG